MNINFNKQIIKDQFLLPISKVVGDDDTNKGCIVNVEPNSINCLCNTKDGSVILNASVFCKTNCDDNTSLNIFDLRKFMRLLECIPDDDISIKLNSNNLSYTSPSISFKYHLMDDGVIRKSVVNIDKINRLTYDTEFSISKSKLEDIFRAASISDDSNKIYIHGNPRDGICGDLTDKTKPNVDSVNIQITKAMLGNEFDQIPLSLDVLRKFSGIKFETINVKLNTQTKILLFELSNDNCILKYIATALVK